MCAIREAARAHKRDPSAGPPPDAEERATQARFMLDKGIAGDWMSAVAIANNPANWD